jgi:hypothetical protein
MISISIVAGQNIMRRVRERFRAAAEPACAWIEFVSVTAHHHHVR